MWWIVVTLGIVEGLTEFLPVSSTGHLILVGHALKFDGPKAATFEIFIQSGAMLAVVLLYWPRFLDLFSLNSNDGFKGLRGLQLLTLTTLPALVAGFFLHRIVKTYLFTPFTVALGLAVGGVVMLIMESRSKTPDKTSLDDLRWQDALVVGFFQCLAIWPGVSRAAATIVGGMVKGLDRKTAAEYSFLAAVPVIGAATAYDLLKSVHLIQSRDWIWFVMGFLVSFLSAGLAVKFFVQFLSRHSLKWFGWYRLILAGLVFWVLK